MLAQRSPISDRNEVQLHSDWQEQEPIEKESVSVNKANKSERVKESDTLQYMRKKDLRLTQV